jgi:hypothetical protein
MVNYVEVNVKVHYDTLWELFDDLSSYYKVEIPMITGGIGYEEYRKFHFDMKKSKKMLHVQVYRLPSGRYECNAYVL